MKTIVILFLCVLATHLSAQVRSVNVSGVIKEAVSQQPLAYVNVLLKTERDSAFVAGTVTNESGEFTISGVAPGNYILSATFVGYTEYRQPLLIGRLSEFLDLGELMISESAIALSEVVVTGRRDAVAETMDKKTFAMSEVVSQSGGSLLQVMQNIPGITVSEEGTIKLRGSDKVAVLIDGKQTALTGFGNQRALDNIPASAIERIEVINNPSAKYDANGNAGIVNIIYKKEINQGLNGKAGLTLGLGALWVKRENYPTIREQYQYTPKVNPTVSINYRKKKVNLFLQADNLYTQTLNKNEFVDRYYDNGDVVRQQTKRNRTTNIVTAKGGVDWYLNDHNTLTVSRVCKRRLKQIWQ